MSNMKSKGKAQTVLGLIDANDLGVTLPHEHLFLDIRCYFAEPDDPEEKKLGFLKRMLQKLGLKKKNEGFSAFYDNLE